MPDLRGLTPLFAELGDLKRTRVAHLVGTLTENEFRKSWAALAHGEAPEDVALGMTARSVAAARLGGLGREVLLRGGLSAGQATSTMRDSFDSVSEPLPEGISSSLRESLASDMDFAEGDVPDFVEALARQPRAGCTRPGRARLVLEPPESHADHCQTVAVYGVLLAELFGAKPREVFLAGLAHHLHNAGMPDAGFTGEMMLADNLSAVVRKFTDDAMSELPFGLRSELESVLARVADASEPLGRAFNAADVIDRVLQMNHYAREASFTVEQALEEMELVHDGPVKDFHESVLENSGLSASSGRSAP